MRKKVNLIAEKMSKDRPRIINKIKEIYSGDSRLHDIDYFEEDIADWVLSEIEKAKTEAKTEAKIEVLEEVARNSGPGDSRYGDFYYLIGEILETLSKLKKKKK